MAKRAHLFAALRRIFTLAVVDPLPGQVGADQFDATLEHYEELTDVELADEREALVIKVVAYIRTIKQLPLGLDSERASTPEVPEQQVLLALE